jgi:hypothetical protein
MGFEPNQHRMNPKSIHPEPVSTTSCLCRPPGLRVAAIVSAWVMAGTAVMITGCSSPAPIEPERALSGVLDNATEPFVHPGRALVAVEVARGPESSISLSRQDETLRQVTQRRADPDQPFRFEVLKTVQRNEGAGWTEQQRRSQTLHLQWHDGELFLSRTIEPGDNVATEFEPALVVLPRRMEPGRSFEQRARIVVRPLDRPDRVKAEGEAQQDTTYEADERLRLPAGDVLAHRVRQVLRMKLGPADITSTSVTWYAPGHGSVAETREEVVRVMGVITRRDVQSWVREAPPFASDPDLWAEPMAPAQSPAQ